MSELDIVPIPPSQWVTCEQAAQILGVTVDRMRALVAKGRFEARCGRNRQALLLREDVEAAARRNQK